MPRRRHDAYEPRNLHKVAGVEEPFNVRDHRDVYTVEKYSYREHLVYVESEGLGSLSLWGGGRYFAEINFKRPGTPLQPFRYELTGDHDYIRADVEAGQRDAIIDLLRNEGPVHLYVFHRGRPEREVHWAWIGTASCAPEEVGEGEG